MNFNDKHLTENNLSVKVAKLLLGHFVSILAAFTILTFIALNTGLTFTIYKIICAILLVLVSIPFIIAYFRLKIIPNQEMKTLIILLIAGLICASLAVISHHISEDDYIYIPNIVYALDHPQEAMGTAVKFVDTGENCEASFFSSGAFEYAQGAFASLLSIEFLAIYYFFTPALASFLIPFALFYALSHFSKNTLVSALSVIITIGVILLLGETGRTYGNFFITRIFHGKTLLLAMGIPLFIGTSLDFFNAPSRVNWLFLFGIATAMVGASFSSIPILSALALVLGIAVFYSSGLKWNTIPSYLFYFAALLFVGVYAVFLLTNSAASDLGVDSPVNSGWPTSFWGHLNFMINPSTPITPIVVVLSTIGALLFTSNKQRKFLIAWIAAIIVLFLNPLIAPIIIRYLTSSNIYWRLFYVFPFPLVLSITTTHLLKKVKLFPRNARYALSALIVILLVWPHFLSFSPSAFNYNTTIKFPPEYKLPPRLNVARDIIAHTPEGPMLTSHLLSGIIPILSSGHPQIHNKGSIFNVWLRNCGRSDIAVLRTEAEAFVHGDVSRFSDFKTFLEVEGDSVTSIVVRKKVMNVDGLNEVLKKHLFLTQIEVENYVIFFK